MQRDKVTFAANIPTQVILDSTGELQPSKNGTDEYRYFLQPDRIMWVPQEVHAAIEAAGAAEGDQITITKRKTGKAAATWEVQQEPAEFGYGRPSPAAPTPATRTAAPPIALQATPDARQQPQPLTTTDKLAGALAAAIDAATEATTYAARRGLTLAWSAGDIRALAATLYIDHARGGRQMPLADNDQTRMTRHQLAQRIEQMQATAQRNGTVGATNDRHRPMEDRRRHEKIANYQAELDRRIRADEAQAAADAREHDQRPQPPPCTECAETGRTAYACTGLETARPLCARHGARAAAARHTPTQEPTPMNQFDAYANDEPTDSQRQTTDDDQARYANRQTKAEMQADEIDARENPPCECHFTGDTADPRGCPAHDPAPRFTIHRPAPVIAPPPAIRHAPDAELLDQLHAILGRYTLGTVLDATWSASRTRDAA